jgi:hypothetical protein
MITLDSPDVFGHCIFCDDIRVENTGKFIYIGVYPAAMRVHGGAFPLVLPKLGIGITYSQRPEKFLKPIKFVMFLPGDADDKPSVESELPEEAVKDAVANAEKLKSMAIDSKNLFATIHANFNFAHLPIAKPGILKVRAVRGDQMIRLGSLLIEAEPAA